MKRIALLVGLIMAAQAGQAFAVVFYDDFENGMGNWTQYPGSAAALALNGPDGAKNIDPVGGLFSARQSALIAGGNGIASYHNFGGEDGFIKAEAYLFEDLTTSQDPVQAAMTLQTANLGGSPTFSDFFRIGILQFSGTNSVYSFRTPAGFTQTSVVRKSGWTKLGIEIDSLVDGGQARFYIDDALVGTASRTAAELSIITLGQNFSNSENFWYDGVSVIPEPSSMMSLGLGSIALLYFRRRRARS